MISAAATLNFIGCYEEEPSEANKGDICLVGACEMVYDGNVWQPLGNAQNEADAEQERTPRICTQCGALLRYPYHKCEFCGTEYGGRV